MLVFAAGIRTIRGILCLLDVICQRQPVFLASQMGHENSQRVYDVYGAWIEEMDGEQVLMLNDKLAR